MLISKDSSSQEVVDKDLFFGKKLLDQEALAIRELAKNLDESFSEAINCLLATEGHVIVAGIGKSGHIARKIASTLSSTGTPAFFIHPSEASHGDLGMIKPQDTMVLLSKSGESQELYDLLGISQRFSIPLITICSEPDSTLSKAANVSIGLPDVTEACPIGLAPTTSSTMMLALGDALAMTLLERKKFTVENFHQLHPGGKLGKSLLRVKDLMHTREALPMVAPTDLMADVLIVMSAKNFGCACVIDSSDVLIGVITDGDLRRHMTDNFLNLPASKVMTKSPQTIEPLAFVAEAVDKMAGTITNLFVVEDSRVAGILRLHDCLRASIAQ